MDLLYFLRRRTQFIRSFYAEASAPFVARRAAIDAGEAPYAPAYNYDGEPRFMAEWTEADESVDVLGQACISMLSSALKLYLDERAEELHRELGYPAPDKAVFKRGWINGYRQYFREALRTNWEDSGVDLDVLEEVVLTRNRAQHPENIDSLTIRQSQHDFSQFPKSFFADETELQIYSRDDIPEEQWLMPWRMNVTGDKLSRAIEEVERLCTWLERRPSWPRSNSGSDE